MADHDTMLAHLALRLTNRTEDLAVEALGYILNKSEATKEALAELVGVGAGILDRVQTQVVIEVGRPDLVCFEGDERRIIIEAKFWANLGEEQAQYYLDKLADSGPAVLLFVAPEARIGSLWRDVKNDVKRELGQDIGDTSSRQADVVGTGQRLMLVSWRRLLNVMAIAASGTPGVQADIRQLQGLTERMDDEELLPFHREDLSPDLARRMRDLRRIYDDVVYRWNDEEWVNTAGYSTSGQPQTGYGRFLKLSGFESWFGVYYDLWGKGDCDNTPFWLQLYGCNQPVLNQVRDQLQLRLSAAPSRSNANLDYVPIHLKIAVGRKEIVDDMVAQLRRIADVIKAAAPTD